MNRIDGVDSCFLYSCYDVTRAWELGVGQLWISQVCVEAWSVIQSVSVNAQYEALLQSGEAEISFSRFLAQDESAFL